MVELISSAKRETELWNQIRNAESCIVEMRELDGFIKGFQFVGKRFPVVFRRETLEHIQQLLTADLARLRKETAQ
jgi:hypothetical protein